MGKKRETSTQNCILLAWGKTSELALPLMFRYQGRDQQTEFPILATPSLSMFQKPLRHEVTKEIHLKISVSIDELTLKIMLLDVFNGDGIRSSCASFP